VAIVASSAITPLPQCSENVFTPGFGRTVFRRAIAPYSSRTMRRGVLLLTGVPGVGKTTIIRKVAERLHHRRRGGFYTEEIRVRGERRGFRAVTFDGEARDMARIDFRGTRRVGKYGVDVSAVDAVAASALTPGADLYLVDEIGKMECLSVTFVAAMRALLESGAPVVATVARRGTGFIAETKRRRDVELWDVTRGNRDALPARVLEWLDA